MAVKELASASPATSSPARMASPRMPALMAATSSLEKDFALPLVSAARRCSERAKQKENLDISSASPRFPRRPGSL